VKVITIQARRPEEGVDPLPISRAGSGRISIPGMRFAGIFFMGNWTIPQEAAILGSHAEKKAVAAIGAGRCQKDAASRDDGRRVPLAGEGGLPEDIVALIP